jgi:hypothetical protein
VLPARGRSARPLASNMLVFLMVVLVPLLFLAITTIVAVTIAVAVAMPEQVRLRVPLQRRQRGLRDRKRAGTLPRLAMRQLPRTDVCSIPFRDQLFFCSAVRGLYYSVSMPWTYNQITGKLTHDGRVVGTGYSGRGFGRNNPLAEAVRGVGPVPSGRYTIGRPHLGVHTGPHTMNLTPVGHNARGRTLLRIHGDNLAHNASHGCIILPPQVRHRISESGDNVLDVGAIDVPL